MPLRQLLWLISFAAGLICAFVVFIHPSFVEWDLHPVETTIETMGYPIEVAKHSNTLLTIKKHAPVFLLRMFPSQP